MPIRLCEGLRSVEVRSSEELSGPAAVHWPRKMILLPRALLMMTGEEQSTVLAHGLVHLERADFVVNC